MENDDLINFDDYSAVGEDVQDVQSELVTTDGTLNIVEDDQERYDPEEDLFGENSQVSTEDTEERDESEEGSLLDALLKDKGYADPEHILIYNENGELETVSFNDLSVQEQRQILGAPDIMLSDDEIATINFLRQNNTTLQDVVAYREQLAVQNALQNNGSEKFVVDDATDEQLFIADLKSKYPNLTEEELADELEDAQYNEDTFKKKVETLRAQYKQLEENERKASIEAAQKAEQENWNQAYQSLLNVAQNTDTLYTLDLDDQDKDDVMRFLLERDATGKTEFIKLLDSPEALFHLAWFAIKGGDAINTIHQHYLKELETTKRGTKPMVQQSSGRPSAVRRQKASTKAEDPYDMGHYFK